MLVYNRRQRRCTVGEVITRVQRGVEHLYPWRTDQHRHAVRAFLYCWRVLVTAHQILGATKRIRWQGRTSGHNSTQPGRVVRLPDGAVRGIGVDKLERVVERTQINV